MSGSNRRQGARCDVVTFYSFKGGVGRSMALANVAAIHAHRGQRVLALDFDFEAPGLHRYFLKRDRYTPAEPRHGVLDLFETLRDRLRAMFPAGRGIQEEDAPGKLRALVAEQIDTGNYLYKVQLTDPNTRPPRDVTIDFIAAARLNNPDPFVRRNYYASLIGRGSVLARLGRYQDAVAAADLAYEQIAAARDVDNKVLLRAAFSNTSFVRLCLAKQTWLGSDEPAARALLEEAASKIADARALAPEEPSMMGDAAYAAFLLGREEEARALLTRALELGGSKIREAALRYADICSLPQDNAFRALVRSIPDGAA